jgi:hypothetical protein
VAYLAPALAGRLEERPFDRDVPFFPLPLSSTERVASDAVGFMKNFVLMVKRLLVSQ